MTVMQGRVWHSTASGLGIALELAAIEECRVKRGELRGRLRGRLFVNKKPTLITSRSSGDYFEASPVRISAARPVSIARSEATATKL